MGITRKMHNMSFFYSMLSGRIQEIDIEGINPLKEQQICDAYFEILRLVNIGKNEGILALDDFAESIKCESSLEVYLRDLLEIATSGIEEDALFHIGMQSCIALNMRSYEGLIALMYFHGIMLVYLGQNADFASKILKSMLPMSIKELIKKK